MFCDQNFQDFSVIAVESASKLIQIEDKEGNTCTKKFSFVCNAQLE